MPAEPTHDYRPPGWHKRPHWAKANKRRAAMPCKADHMDRESCPFHDLRADGCFQPEHGGLGVEGQHLEPWQLVKRPDGNRLDCGANKPQRYGCGGMLLPEDTEPNPNPPCNVQRTCSSRPWTSTGKRPGVFSTPEYVSLPPRPPLKPTIESFFHTGKARDIIASKFQHMPDPYQQPQVHDPRLAFRLHAGVPRRTIDPRFKFISADELPPQRARSAGPKRQIPRQQFSTGKPLQGTFGYFPSFEAAPYVEPSLKSNRRPLFTYAAKTKRSMPVLAPWTTGLSSAEAAKPPELSKLSVPEYPPPRAKRPATAK